jgi:hypothetical protein
MPAVRATGAELIVDVDEECVPVVLKLCILRFGMFVAIVGLPPAMARLSILELINLWKA